MDSTLRTTVLQSHPNTILIAYHTTADLVPPFNHYQGDSVFDLYPQVGERSAFPNGLGYGVDYESIGGNIDSLNDLNLQTPVVIEFNSKSLNQDTVELSLTILNDGPELKGSYWYNVIVTEDSIVEPHRSMYGCSHPEPSDPDYINSWVTRKLIFWSQGKSLIEDSWPEQQAITQTFSFSLNDGWVPENCNVTVHVFKKENALYQSPTMQVVQEPVIGWSDIAENEPIEQEIMGIYPNPTKGLTNIHIALTDKGFCSLSVFDTNGRQVKRLLHSNRNPGLYNIEMQTSELPGGTYIIVLETSTGKTSKKLIIQ